MEVEQHRLRIQVFRSPDLLVRIHPRHERLLARSTGGFICCTCGPESLEALLIVDPIVPEDMVLVSDTLFRKLVFDAMPNWVHAEVRNRRIHIGPTIGILCNPRWDTKNGRLTANKQLPALQKMAELGAGAGALVYLFRIQDVDFDKRTVEAYVLANDQWKKLVLPMPDAVYDQVISRKVERNPKYIEKRKKLSQVYEKRIFNDGFFDKWEVHDWLTGDRRTRPFVPSTTKYSQSKDVIQFLQHHQVVFFKPIHGSLGLGIVRVVGQQDRSFEYEVKRQTGTSTGKAQGPEGVVEALRTRLKQRPYLIQQGIPLAMYNGRPFDIRIVLQRDGSGEWKRTKMFARIAQPGDFTSNLSSGGEALPVDTVLKEVFDTEARRRQCRILIRKVSQLVPTVIEEQAGKEFGELGIDLGVDNQGHVWVIEVNSKPWKSPTTEKGRQDLVDLAFARPLQYALRIAHMN